MLDMSENIIDQLIENIKRVELELRIDNTTDKYALFDMFCTVYSW